MHFQEPSRRYRCWHDKYKVEALPKLDLPRPVLYRWLVIPPRHSDFEQYHRRFHHKDAKPTCSCGRAKTPEYLALCEIAQRTVRYWPRNSLTLLIRREGDCYLCSLETAEFAELLRVTAFYAKICTTTSIINYSELAVKSAQQSKIPYIESFSIIPNSLWLFCPPAHIIVHNTHACMMQICQRCDKPGHGSRQCWE
ncbi:hypothetical protein N7520_008021 [Penicillium odoratum]|uniref:uncharacterized protein n=1 Tax=Penicillium odoratum TaxID=1167516 RepID=UPI0025468536|nr:uncharacterized protein N7520_008021 [Penicillium odoratum]KAJ5760865.1 hypothetical protein N7520_008021 [Penicillium odoratum]